MPSEIPSLAQGIGGSTLGSASVGVHAPRRSGSTAALGSSATPPSSSQGRGGACASERGGDGKKTKVCSEPSCPNPAKKKCNACKVARYCCAECQKQHWRLEPHGHKTECDVLAALKKKEAFWFTASDGAGAEQGGRGGGGGGGSASASGGGGPACASGGVDSSSSGGSSSDDVASTTTLSSLADAESEDGGDGEGLACYICLDADAEVVPLGCACRGAAGGAHVLCMIEAAAHAHEHTGGTSWLRCSLCHQRYTGKMQMGLAEERVHRAQHLPETDVESVDAYAGLADALQEDGKDSEAEMVYRKVLALYQRLFGAEHPAATLAAANNLAWCLRHQCKFEEAIKLHKSTLRSQRRVLGMEHRDTLGTKSNLATALKANGQLEEAEKMFRTTLKTMKRVLPKNDAFMLATLMGFAALLTDGLGKHAEAEAMFRELLAIRLQMLGSEHPLTLMTKGNVCITLRSQGKYAEALPLARESYRGYTKVYSSKHPSTLNAASHLGDTLMELGEYVESEAILRETLVLEREVLGPEDLQTKRTATHLQTLISNGDATVQTMP
eukprot:gene32642-biopygen8655